MARYPCLFFILCHVLLNLAMFKVFVHDDKTFSAAEAQGDADLSPPWCISPASSDQTPRTSDTPWFTHLARNEQPASPKACAGSPRNTGPSTSSPPWWLSPNADGALDSLPPTHTTEPNTGGGDTRNRGWVTIGETNEANSWLSRFARKEAYRESQQASLQGERFRAEFGFAFPTGNGVR